MTEPTNSPHLPSALSHAATHGDDDLAGRLHFLVELDALKAIMRRNLLVDGSRTENTAEHSWHLAMFAWVLAPYADEAIDLPRVMRMLLVHDVVEIDAGDTYIYDTDGAATKAAREEAAADRLFGLLPAPFGTELRALWEEYEARDTADARFAYAVDRMQPLLLNALSGGRSWQAHGVAADRVRAVNSPIGDASERLWAVASAILDDAVRDGRLRPE